LSDVEDAGISAEAPSAPFRMGNKINNDLNTAIILLNNHCPYM